MLSWPFRLLTIKFSLDLPIMLWSPSWILGVLTNPGVIKSDYLNRCWKSPHGPHTTAFLRLPTPVPSLLYGLNGVTQLWTRKPAYYDWSPSCLWIGLFSLSCLVSEHVDFKCSLSSEDIFSGHYNGVLTLTSTEITIIFMNLSHI